MNTEMEKIQTLERIESREKKSDKQSFWEMARFVLLAIAIVIPIRIYIAQPFVVSGSSMIPTFENGQYLIIDEISYRLEDPERYDVVVFRYPNDTKKFFIKRIIGLPNETINIEGSKITIVSGEYPAGLELDQSYLIKNTTVGNMRFELKENEYFVMGDNRSASSDSRYWGAVPRKLIIGKAFLRLLPINKIDLLPGSYSSKQ